MGFGSVERSEDFELHQRGTLAAAMGLSKCLSRANLCCWSNMGECPQASHTIKHHKPTNQHSCHMAGNVLSERTLGVLILYFMFMPKRKTGILALCSTKSAIYSYLWSNIIRSSAKCFCRFISSNIFFAHSKICNLDVTILIQHHIVQF